MLDITVNTSVQNPVNSNVTLNLTAGNLTVNIRMYGTVPDNFGVLLYNVSLQ